MNPFAISLKVDIGLQDFSLSWDPGAHMSLLGFLFVFVFVFVFTLAHVAISSALDSPGLKFSNESL